jgi:hypothetical protein
MKKSVRIVFEIPASLHRQLERHASDTGKSVRELLLDGAKQAVSKSKQAGSKRVDFPLFGSDGPKIDLTNEQIYELIEFP